MPLPANATYFKLIAHKSAAAAIKSARISKNLTGKEAAELVGLSQPQLSKIENGHQAFFTDKVKGALDKLAEVLEVQPLRWTEADWREDGREPSHRRTQVKRVTTSAREVTEGSSESLDSRSSVTTLLDLYDAGVLERAVVLDALTNLTKEA